MNCTNQNERFRNQSVKRKKTPSVSDSMYDNQYGNLNSMREIDCTPIERIESDKEMQQCMLKSSRKILQSIARCNI